MIRDPHRTIPIIAVIASAFVPLAGVEAQEAGDRDGASARPSGDGGPSESGPEGGPARDGGPEEGERPEETGEGTGLVYEEVVIARGDPEPSFSAARSTAVVDAENLSEQAPRTTPEALWEAPGVFVQHTNHGGGSPIIRGLIGPQNLILVDGVRLNNSTYRTGPLQYLNLIDPLSIRRIEVLRGPGSVLYGSDAMGGVIEVFPLSPPGELDRRLPLTVGVVGRLGSADVQRTLHGRLGGSVGPISVLGGGTYSAFDDLQGGRGIGRQAYSGYVQGSAFVRLELTLAERSRMIARFSAGYLMSQIDDAGRTDKLVDSRSLQLYDNLDHLVYGRLRLQWPRARTSAQLTLSYQSFFERKDSFTLDQELIGRERLVRDEVGADTLGLDLHLSSRLIDRRLHLRTGATWYHDWVGADRYQGVPGDPLASSQVASYPDGSTYDTYGLYLMLEGTPLLSERGHQIRLDGGYRFHGMAGAAPSQEELPEVEFSYLGHIFLAGAQYLYRDRFNLSLTFSQGFRAPNLNEAVMLGDTGKLFHVPNPDLGPERSDTFELLARGRFWRFTLGGAAYLSLLHDLILREETEWGGRSEVGGKPVAWNVNGGEGLLWGVEAQLGLDIGWGLSISGTLTYTRGEGQGPEGDTAPLSRIPPLFGQVALRYQIERPNWTAFAETFVRAASAQDRLSPEDVSDVRIPEGGTPGWWTWHIRAGVTAYERFSLRLSVDNILNEPYKIHGSGVYGPGIGVRVTGELLY